MTKAEIKTAKSIIDSYVERTETLGVEGGGVALSVQCNDGSQQIFYSLQAVADKVAELQQRA